MRRLSLFILAIPVLAIATLVVTSTAAHARCTDAQDLRSFWQALDRQVECRIGNLTRGFDSPCPPPEIPTCAEPALSAALEVAFGAEASTAAQVEGSPGSRHCQITLARAGADFASFRLRERAQGRRRTRGGRIPKPMSHACDGVVVERTAMGLVPQVGGPCASLTDKEGRAIDGTSLQRCIRASLEKIVDDASPSPLRPNIVLALTDDQRWDTLGYMPATFDNLAGRGLVFQNAFATTPICSPSRASIYSGLLPRNHGVQINGQEPLFDASTNVAVALAQAGYTNGFFGKYMNAGERFGPFVPPGWDDWQIFLEPAGGSFSRARLNINGEFRTLGPEQYSTDFLAAQATRFIQANVSRPFFLVYAPFAPHAPAEPAPRHRGTYSDLPLHRPPNWREEDVSKKPDWVRFLAQNASGQGAFRRDRERQEELETLLSVDDAVLELTRVLERAGLTDQTVFVYASDHGIHWGEHWNNTKFSAYEESIRIPYVLRYPALSPLPRLVPELVANIDLAPTFAALAGTTLEGERDGTNLLPLIDRQAEGTAGAWRRELALESSGGLIVGPWRALRTEEWKYIETLANAGVRYELYDLINDRYELDNLATDPMFQSQRTELAARLAAALP